MRCNFPKVRLSLLAAAVAAFSIPQSATAQARFKTLKSRSSAAFRFMFISNSSPFQVTCLWDASTSECIVNEATLDPAAVSKFLAADEALEVCFATGTTCPIGVCKRVTLSDGPPNQCVPAGFQLTSNAAGVALGEAVNDCVSSCADEYEAFYLATTGCVGCGTFLWKFVTYATTCGAFTSSASCTGASASGTTSPTTSSAPPSTSGPATGPSSSQAGDGMATCMWNPDSAACNARASGPNSIAHDTLISEFVTCLVETVNLSTSPAGCASSAPGFCSSFFEGQICLPATAPYTDPSVFIADFELFLTCIETPSSQCDDFWIAFFNRWNCPECIPEALAINSLQGTCALATSETTCSGSITVSSA